MTNSLRDISSREKEWDEFEVIASSHIVNYANLQFGDKGEDQVTDWSKEDILKQIRKYALRNTNENRRGRLEVLRDMLKIAHYACMLFWKLCPTEEETQKLARGE